MKLIVITNETIFDDEGLVLNKIFDKGLGILHLRKPFATESEIRQLLDQIDHQYYERIVLHDYFHLLPSLGLRGIHLNRRNPIRPHSVNGSVSRSCHSIECLKTSMNDHNYMFLSPIFDSISKLGYKQAFTEDELIDAHSHRFINEKVIALGGVNQKTIPIVAQYGFGGVALLGAVWGDYVQDKNEEDLFRRFTNLQTMIDKL